MAWQLAFPLSPSPSSHISDIKGDIRETQKRTRIINEYTSEYYANESHDRFFCLLPIHFSSGPSHSSKSAATLACLSALEIKFQFLIIELFSLVFRAVAAWAESYLLSPWPQVAGWLRSLHYVSHQSACKNTESLRPLRADFSLIGRC
jgi:hypothetical protein